MVDWKALEELLRVPEPGVYRDPYSCGCVHDAAFIVSAEGIPRLCLVCEVDRLRTQCRDLIDTVLACLRAAGGSDDLDTLEWQCNAAGPRPSFFVAQQIRELQDFIVDCGECMAGRVYDPDLMDRLARRAREIAAQRAKPANDAEPT